MYRRAREKANLSREEAAFRANIGTRTLAKYEAGETTPPADVVLRLAEVYNDLDLISEYCSRECAIGRVFRPKVKTADIAVSTLRLLAELKDVNDTIDRLVQIASDGHVSTAEMDDFWCGTHPCPYPRDEEFAQQIEEHGKEWLRNMPCWTPIEEELSVVSWTCPYCKRSMYSSWERPDEKMTTCIYCGMVFENPYYREGGGE